MKDLGHIISEEVMKADPKKIQALKNFTAPKNLGGVRRILGLFGYYREFISNYATLTEPLIECLRGKKAFRWNLEQDEALRKLKEEFSEKILRIPLDGDSFILETDTFGFAIAAILSTERDGKAYL